MVSQANISRARPAPASGRLSRNVAGAAFHRIAGGDCVGVGGIRDEGRVDWRCADEARLRIDMGDIGGIRIKGVREI
jgi:hypothetical protein